ncbi:ATP-binding cassette domain-containing protein [Paenibacillus sp. MMS20-IR301]|uniref:ATP-binding cassette domain-containing protein n=1 Tax=Paenibacillus sp. MMS20-IR301 TaxID=2895946 RepID=UPI0028EB5F19|nr:ATP-binding cassette domain-containing protein [Paenibacillus sp. MMS20-IR301]WNS40768.1 ATP-binding cassette domain-containing protein [Paenibacillus sp. MMS20-IR301]
MKDIMLKTSRLSKKYKEAHVLRDIDMTIYKGDIYGLIGKNGAGKTTFIRILSTLITPSSGEFRFSGPEVKVAAVIESPALYMDMTAEENLKYSSIQKNCYSRDKIADTLAFIGLEHTQRKQVKDFSLGMKQRLGIGLAILDAPDFLILDEPVNGLDPMGIIEIRQMITKINQELGTTLLISSHFLAELALVATRYGVLHEGALIQEFSNEDLQKELTGYRLLETSDNNAAIALIQGNITGSVQLKDRYLEFTASDEICIRISNALLEAGISIYRFLYQQTELEDYFLQVVGGQKVAL